MDTAIRHLLLAAFICLPLLWPGCGASDPTRARPLAPSCVPVGPLTVGVWLPAGLGALQLDAEDQQRLQELDINWLQWLQPAADDSLSAEQAAMQLCALAGWQMPVYYASPGYSPYDKLRNWAKRTDLTAEFPAAVAERVQALQRHWGDAPGLGGYLVGHEDYRREYYPALAQVVDILARTDSARPAFSVGRLPMYRGVDQFLDALFVEGGTPNVFQHEHYVFRSHVPTEGKEFRLALRDLVAGYDEVAARLANRHGRWHAIVQAHEESRNQEPFYRQPGAAELRLQAGLALSRGASGIVYFLYSSGAERVLNADGDLVQERYYGGLVRSDGTPTAAYRAAQLINADLQRLSPRLGPLYFHGGYASADLPRNPLVRNADAELDLGLFGDSAGLSHVLVVNRRTTQPRLARMQVAAAVVVVVVDAVTGEELPVVGDQVQVALEPGGFRLLRIMQEGERE